MNTASKLLFGSLILSSISLNCALAQGRVLIAYFSLYDSIPENVDASTAATRSDFNTHSVAEYLESKTQGRLFRIRSDSQYPHLMHEAMGFYQNQLADEEFPALKEKVSLQDYDEIYLGYPVWLNSMPQEIRVFLNENKDVIKKKRLAVFSTTGASSNQGSIKEIKRMIGKKDIPSLLIKINQKDSFKTITDDWLKEINSTANK